MKNKHRSLLDIMGAWQAEANRLEMEASTAKTILERTVFQAVAVRIRCMTKEIRECTSEKSRSKTAQKTAQ